MESHVTLAAAFVITFWTLSKHPPSGMKFPFVKGQFFAAFKTFFTKATRKLFLRHCFRMLGHSVFHVRFVIYFFIAIFTFDNLPFMICDFLFGFESLFAMSTPPKVFNKIFGTFLNVLLF